MSTHPTLNNDPELFKIGTKDVELKHLKYKTEKLDHENILKSFKTNNENYKKKYKCIIKKKMLIFITEVLKGGGSTLNSSTLEILNPSAVIIMSSSAALLTGVAVLITDEYFSKLKLGQTKLRKWINVVYFIIGKDFENFHG